MFIRVLSMVAAVQIALYWLVSARVNAVLGQTTTLLAESQPLLIGGATIQFESVAVQLSGSARFVEDRLVKRYLLLVSADKCAPSRRIAPAWKGLIESTTFGPDDLVVLVTFDGTENFADMVPVLKRKRVPYAMARATSVPEFAMRTGIRATPFLAVLDKDHHLQVVSYRMSPTILGIVSSRFKNGT